MPEGVWSRTVELRSKDVNMFRKLRTSRLFELLQEASIAHTEELGWPRETTLDRDFLWMIAMQRIEIERMPDYGESIGLKSWPGPMMHVLYPRQYRIEDEGGDVLLRGSAIWTLVDMNTRAMANPDDHGVVIEGVSTGDELALPGTLRPETCDHTASFTVPFSYCDLNGHMNNTRYFDLFDDTVSETLPLPASVRVEYHREVRCHDQLHLRFNRKNDSSWLEGTVDDQLCFRMKVARES